jgi:hypothetical protein
MDDDFDLERKKGYPRSMEFWGLQKNQIWGMGKIQD